LAANGFWLLAFEIEDIGQKCWMTKAKNTRGLAIFKHGLIWKRLTKRLSAKRIWACWILWDLAAMR